VDEAALRGFLEVHLGGNQARIEATLERFLDPRVVERLPDAGVRAGFLTLTGTLGDLVVEPFLAGELDVTGFCYGTPADPDRIVGPAAPPGPDAIPVDDALGPAGDTVDPAGTAVGPSSTAVGPSSTAVGSGTEVGSGTAVGRSGTAVDPAGTAVGSGIAVGPVDVPDHWRVVNERYRFEPYPLLAGCLLHELLRHEPPVSHAEETVLHALAAAVHLQILARTPDLAGRTELARRQSSLALALLCSRVPGQATVRMIAPDGPGTIPGGAPFLWTPDFWSLPFRPDLTEARPPTAAFRAVLDALLGPPPELEPPRLVDERLAEQLDEQVLATELRPHELVAAAVALGLADASVVHGATEPQPA
jgi:hypothetical protein